MVPFDFYTLHQPFSSHWPVTNMADYGKVRICIGNEILEKFSILSGSLEFRICPLLTLASLISGSILSYPQSCMAELLPEKRKYIKLMIWYNWYLKSIDNLTYIWLDSRLHYTRVVLSSMSLLNSVKKCWTAAKSSHTLHVATYNANEHAQWPS